MAVANGRVAATAAAVVEVTMPVASCAAVSVPVAFKVAGAPCWIVVPVKLPTKGVVAPITMLSMAPGVDVTGAGGVNGKTRSPWLGENSVVLPARAREEVNRMAAKADAIFFIIAGGS
jgi:hypothetical protein